MEKEIIWTLQAKKDLQDIYFFARQAFQDEEKAFTLIKHIIQKTEQLSDKISGGTRSISDLHPEIPYQKLIYKHYLIIYRHSCLCHQDF